MKLAVFGGSFDPVHCGHLAVADAARAALAPDLLLWVPARHAPHKTDEPSATAADRLVLLGIAVAGRPGEVVETLECERPGPSYTVDTLRALGQRHPAAELHLILGADSLLHLHTWRAVPELLERASLALVPRPGSGPHDLDAFAARLPAAVRVLLRAQFLPMDEVAVSSTEVRRRLCAGEPVDGLLPEAVRAEIARRGLYCPAS
ncbi:MAG TPA: nicotinate-nucleotide adenylyltransferase [Planctomycetota bacterium]